MPAGQQGGSAARESESLPSRREIIRKDIAQRLRHICAHLSDQEFANLVDAMAEQKLKGERRRSL